MEISSKIQCYQGCATRYTEGTRIPIKKRDVCYHPTPDPFWLKQIHLSLKIKISNKQSNNNI